jgi:hypothetical protein
MAPAFIEAGARSRSYRPDLKRQFAFGMGIAVSGVPLEGIRCQRSKQHAVTAASGVV